MSWINRGDATPESCCKIFLALIAATGAGLIPLFMMNRGYTYVLAGEANSLIPSTPCPEYTTAANGTELFSNALSLCGMGNNNPAARSYMVQPRAAMPEFYHTVIEDSIKPALNAPVFNMFFGIAGGVLGIGLLASLYYVNKREKDQSPYTQNLAFTYTAIAATAGAAAALFNMPKAPVPASITLGLVAISSILYVTNQKRNDGPSCTDGKLGKSAAATLTGAVLIIGIFVLADLSSESVNNSFVSEDEAKRMGCTLTETGIAALSDDYDNNFFCSTSVQAGNQNQAPLTTLVNAFVLMKSAAGQISTGAAIIVLLGTVSAYAAWKSQQPVEGALLSGTDTEGDPETGTSPRAGSGN